METFHLQILTAEGTVYDGPALSLTCRTICGDVSVLARHCDYCTAVGEGRVSVRFADGTKASGSCAGGILAVLGGECRLLAGKCRIAS